MRLQENDIIGGTFTPKKLEGVVDYSPVTEIVFTIRGSHDYMYQDLPAINDKEKNKADGRKDACAKKVGHRYFIKINNRGDVFNPIDPEHLRSSNKTEYNLPIWKYTHVPYTTFAHYAHFLKTRNQTFLTLARRDMGSTS
jgi:hypothetical protein